jgi:hypothetical protein
VSGTPPPGGGRDEREPKRGRAGLNGHAGGGRPHGGFWYTSPVGGGTYESPSVMGVCAVASPL